MSYTVGFHYWRYGIGGAERVTFELMRMFVEIGYKVLLYTDERPTDEDYPVPDGVVRLVVPQDAPGRKAFWCSQAIEAGVDLVIYSAWLSEAAPSDCAAIHAAGMRLVYSTHGAACYFVDKPNGARLLDIMTSCAILADAVVCLSEADVSFWSALCGNVYAVTNPVSYLGDVAVCDRSAHGHEVVWVGRFDPVEKRPDLGIRAFAALRERVADATLVMVGGGNDGVEHEVRELAEELGVSEAVAFTGQVGDAMPYLEHADAFMMTSPTEGFSLSLLEAQSVSLPTVMFRMPWLTGAIGCEGVTQVPFGDTHAMGEALGDVLGATDYVDKSAASRERYEEIRDVDLSGAWARVVKGAMGGRVEPAMTWRHRETLSFVEAFNRLSERRSSESRDADEMRRERDRLYDESESLRSDLEATRASVSFRLGRLLTAVPRVLREKVMG